EPADIGDVPTVAGAGGSARIGGAAGGAGTGTLIAPTARTVGLNYVVIQSYPDQKMAEEAVKILHEGGIDATIERLPAWSNKPTWVQVVGLTGFEKTSSPQFVAYQNK